MATEKEPTAPGMPSYGWQLNDSQVVAVLTYIRNSWGNAASACHRTMSPAKGPAWRSDPIEGAHENGPVLVLRARPQTLAAGQLSF